MAQEWEPPSSIGRWPIALALGAAVLVVSLLLGALLPRGRDSRLELTRRPDDVGWTSYSPAAGRRIFDRPPVEGEARWTRLPEPGLPARDRPLLVWTGDEVLVLGGEDRQDGAAWQPEAQRWRWVAEAPAPLRTDVAAWTGRDAVAVTRTATLHYDPGRDAWEQAPGPPSELFTGGHASGSAVVVDEQMVVAGTGSLAMAVYDLRARRWTALPVPVPAQRATPALITHGPRLALFGDTSRGSLGWSVSLEDGTSHPLPVRPWPEDAPPLDWFRAVASAGDRFVIAQNTTATRAAVIRAAGWRPLAGVPGLVRRPIVVGVNAGVVVWSSEVGRGAIYRRSAGSWQRLDPAPLLTSLGSGVAMGNEFFLWGRDRAAVWTPERR